MSLKTIPKRFPYEKPNNDFTTFLLAAAHCVPVNSSSYSALQGRVCQLCWNDVQWCPMDMKSALFFGSAMDS